MDANIVEQAVADVINAGTYDLTLTAQPSLLPSWNFEDLRGIRVTVSALTRQTMNDNREDDEHGLDLLIGIGSSVAKPTEEHVRPLITLVDQIEEQLRTSGWIQLPGDEQMAWIEANIDPYYDQDLLREWLVFGSLIAVRYQSIS